MAKVSAYASNFQVLQAQIVFCPFAGQSVLENFLFAFRALNFSSKFFQAQIQKNIFQNFHIPVYRLCPVVSIASRDEKLFA